MRSGHRVPTRRRLKGPVRFGSVRLRRSAVTGSRNLDPIELLDSVHFRGCGRLVSTETPDARLRSASLRVAAVRTALLEQVDELPHAGVELLVGALERQLGTVLTPGGVRRLEDARAGASRPLHRAGGQPGPLRGKSRRQPPSRRLPSMRAAADLDCAVGETPCLEPSSTHGFLLDEAEVTFWGLCPRCAREAERHGRAATTPRRHPGRAVRGGAGADPGA